jgi:acetylornithine/succinyldiaminopimelate/putrescine aminotransferase
VIDIVREEGLLERAAESGRYFTDRLRELSSRQPAIANVRGQGLMIGFDLVVKDAQKMPVAVNDFMFGCRNRGVHLTYGFGGVNFRIIPPLIITRKEMDFAIQVMEETLRVVLAKEGGARDEWPSNQYTRSLFEKHPWKRLWNCWWRSSPEDLLEKGRELIHGQ